MIKSKCEGENCESVKNLKKYSVKNKNKKDKYDWGTFTYCENCKKEDIKNGFEVKEI